ncbi:MAG: UDP-N-acetylmuramoyl-tripeptide--D-alanyl-D-alanine ligase, partial [Lentisphaeraceae bacterium]|nr:UDP-N-acetylmuramoyl-tripeptide--D-alanyl-D-alanine ligase [Lentisphaeraceae bacterium]
AVLERGTNHPGEIAVLAKCAAADIAILTSIGNSHSGNFPVNDGILQEKCDLLRFMKKEALAFIPFENEKSI